MRNKIKNILWRLKLKWDLRKRFKRVKKISIPKYCMVEDGYLNTEDLER